MRRLAFLLVFLVACAEADPPSGEAAAESAAPTAIASCPRDGRKHAYFGNLHQHTSYSIDAYGFGTRNTPAEAYEFAKGRTSLPVAQAYLGKLDEVHIDRPLDFLAVTDHSEWLGVQQAVEACRDASDTSDRCASLRAQERSAWRDERHAAEDAYEPCRFTSFVAYEWTSMVDDDSGNPYTNHRNVVFGSAEVPAIPLDSDTFPTTNALFDGLDRFCGGDCQALVIPHNTNLSEGLSLKLPGAIGSGELAQMQKYQRLVEIYQHKGSSECFSDPNGATDPACAFEYVAPGDPDDTPQSYVRTALGNGMAYAVDHASANPLELGIIASTDDHNGIAGLVKEDRYVGHLGITDAAAALRLSAMPQFGPGGLAGVWAEENTRPALFAALERRETFGTSGPRILVQFFQTPASGVCTGDFPANLVAPVPMGGTFHRAAGAHFAVAVWPDTADQPVPGGPARPAGLASLEIIKASTVAVGGKRRVKEEHIPLAITARGGCVEWTDEALADLGPDDQALYYVRVLQEPTWRWSHFDCEKAPDAAGCKDGTLDVAIQERAWSSPIWYVP